MNILNKKTIIFFLVVLLALTGCSFGGQKGELSEIEEGGTDKVNIEYICNHYDVDQSEFNGVDFNAFVEYYGITNKNIEDGTIFFLLDLYKNLEYKVKIPQYTELQSTTDVFLPEYKEKLDLVIVNNYITDGTTGTLESTIIDFDLGFVFVGNNLNVVSEKNIVKETDESLKESLKTLIDKYGISELEKQNYIKDDSSKHTTDGIYPYCYLMIRMEDGTIYGTSYVKNGEESDSLNRFYGFAEEVTKLAREE